MRSASVLIGLTLVASGCVSARWSVATSAPRPVSTLSVAAVELQGDADGKVARARRAGLIDSLRARGYDVRDEAPGVPCLHVKLTGRGVSDAQMHAPDDRRHRIENDLHYYFVAYHVDIELSDGRGSLLAMGSADSNEDPAPALRALAVHLFSDVPPELGPRVAAR